MLLNEQLDLQLIHKPLIHQYNELKCCFVHEDLKFENINHSLEQSNHGYIENNNYADI